MSVSPVGALDHCDSPASGADEQGTRLHPHDAGLLLLRLALGLPMASHGAQKLFGWFFGAGVDSTEQFFASVGYPSCTAIAVVAGLSELLGRLASLWSY